MDAIDRDDPMVAPLMELPAYALDYVRIHYRRHIHGMPTMAAVCSVLRGLFGSHAHHGGWAKQAELYDSPVPEAPKK
jgi:hypothetical protein